VKPELADLEWVKISYPTPFGNIDISAEKKNGETVFEVKAPEEIEIVK
jgi:Holliday junction resolvase-like predicted endonuclease